jgi:4-amino-4-deoxy-L-arabinose transferase-like glycosyltransferase
MADSAPPGWLVRAWPEWLLSALAVPVIFYGLGSYSLVNGDEEIYHVVAEHMVQSGDWIRLQFYDEHRVYDTFMNAPLQYWARAILISLFGSNLWTMRILSALFGWATVLMTCRLARELGGDRPTALLAGLVQLTTFQFVYLHSTRTGELDSIVAFFYSALALLFLRGVQGRGFALHHVCLALLFNLKSPIVLIPLLAEAACFALLPATRATFRPFLLSAAKILPFALIWHAARMVQLWEPFLEVMGQMAREAGEHQRGATEKGRLANVSFYLSTVLFGAWPWCFAHPFALLDTLRTQRRRSEGLGWWILAIFVGALLLFYVFVSKHHRWYVVPAYPLLSVFVAHWIVRSFRQPLDAWSRAAVAGVGALVAWSWVSIPAYNPFALKAWVIPMNVHWRSLLGLPALAGVVLTAALLFAAMHALARAGEARAGRVALAVVTTCLLGIASVRIAFPLRYVDYQSPTALLRNELDYRATHDIEVDYPIERPGNIPWDAPFYFRPPYSLEQKEPDSYLIHLQSEDGT